MHRASAIRHIVVNPGANDPISGESLDFKIMVDKLHQGIDLPTLSEAGNKYSLFTYNGSKETIFAENDGIWALNNKGTIDGIHYPQDIRNCTGCHADDADLVLNPNLQGIIISKATRSLGYYCIILSDSALYIASSRSTRENAWHEPEPFTETSHVEPSNRHLCLS